MAAILECPEQKLSIIAGSIIRIGRFESIEWMISYGWYTWGGNRPVCGWYLMQCDAPSNIKPFQATDLDDIYIIEEPIIPPEPTPGVAITEEEKDRYDRAFISVESYTDLETLEDDDLHNGKLVRVNADQDGQSRYYWWSEAELRWNPADIGQVIEKTTAEWEEYPELISTQGTMYVWSDKYIIGETNVPGLKIGDGVTLVKDLPFTDAYMLSALNSKADKSELPTKTSDLTNDSDYQTGTQVSDAISSAVSSLETEIQGKADKATTYTKSEVDAALATKADESAIPTKVSDLDNDLNYTTSTELIDAMNDVLSDARTYSDTGDRGVLRTAAEYTNEIAESKADKDDTYTKTEVDTALADKADKSSTYTKSEVDTIIENLPEPMIFKGTLGVNGTITDLPVASSANEGFTYKVITDGTYQGIVAKVGDVFTSNGSEWVLIPSGDEENDTWREIKVNGTTVLNSAISSGSVDFVEGDNINITFDADGNKVEIVADTIDDTQALTTKSWSGKKTFDEIYNILPTETASGSIANFNTSFALPMEIVADVNASGGGGTPATPIPIVGVSAVNVVKCGGNFWNEEWELGIYDNTTGEKQTYNLCIRNRNKIYLKGGTSYYIYLGSGNAQIYKYDKNDQYLGYIPYMNRGVISLESDVAYINFNMNTAYGTTYNNNISINSSTDTTYHTYTAPTTTLINLGGTHYGGQLEIDKDGHRRFKVTYGALKIGDVEWIYSGGYFRTRNVVSDMVKSSSNLTVYPLLCSVFSPKSWDDCVSGNYNYSMAIGWLNQNHIAVYNSDYSSSDTFVSAFENTYIYYPLATPYYIDLADGEPINSLVGDNNIYHDGNGDISVEYKELASTGGSVVTVNPVVTTGTDIATITVDGTTKTIKSPVVINDNQAGSNTTYSSNKINTELSTKSDTSTTYTKTEVDNALEDICQNFAQSYDETATYAQGDIVIYDNVYYECITAISTPEVWDSTKWQQSNVAETIDEVSLVVTSAGGEVRLGVGRNTGSSVDFIDDNTVSATTTWSSQKLDGLLILDGTSIGF